MIKAEQQATAWQWMIVAAAFLYLLGNLGIILALRAGAIRHAVFSPVEISRFLTFCSLSVLILAPVPWWVFLRAHIEGKVLMFVLAVIGATLALDFWCYWLAAAAV